jgi:hypothetical protein
VDGAVVQLAREKHGCTRYHLQCTASVQKGLRTRGAITLWKPKRLRQLQALKSVTVLIQMCQM